MIDICQRLILPALRNTDDVLSQLIGIESIGLLGLLNKELFMNYSAIFSALLEERIEGFNETLEVEQGSLHETIVALKAIFDGLIMHGIDTETRELQDYVIANFLYCHNLPLRQIAVEGVAKLMFSIKGQDMADPQQREVSIAIISHLVI